MEKKPFRLRIAAVPLAALLGVFAAVTPALGATAGTAQASSHGTMTRADGVVSGARTLVRPDTSIQQQPCTAARATWVHITQSEGTSLTVTCFGFTGIWLFSGNTSWMVCAGNNYGTLRYYDPEHEAYETWDFSPGSVIAWSYGVDLTSLTINGWSQSDTC
jgi:hypothetical protein